MNLNWAGKLQHVVIAFHGNGLCMIVVPLTGDAVGVVCLMWVQQGSFLGLGRLHGKYVFCERQNRDTGGAT